MALNPDEYRKRIILEDPSPAEPVEFSRSVYLGPLATETSQELEKQCQRRFAILDSYRDSVWRILVRDFFQHYVDPSAAVLDLGSGWGEFIRHIHAHRRVTMDLNPDMPSHVDSHVETILQDCSEPWQISDSSLDVVFTSNYFEHLLTRTRFGGHYAKRCVA
jgi:Methyltransferase domain